MIPYESRKPIPYWRWSVVEMRKLPLGIQNFRKIIEGDYVYVDKTRYIHSLITNASYYFLSRPRRFGKSLLLDTIGEALGGSKELFKGLFIYDSGYNFEKHPVLRLDMSNIANETPEILKNELTIELRKRAKTEGFDIDYETPSAIFKTLIEALYIKYDQRLVVLIDEYDKPILDRLNNSDIAEANRDVLKGFYGILKSMDPFLRFTFITGVSKFTKTSIFSELNNLFDITLTEDYSSICGIAPEDLDRYFGEYIESMAKLDSFKRSNSVRDDILAWYDGYSWDGKTRVINPFSLLSCFMQKRFSSFWYSSGSPKFLTDLIKLKPESYANLSNLRIGEWELDTFDIQRIEVEPLLFQTGYLTIKKALQGTGVPEYQLDIPNYEVRMALNLHILAEFTEKGSSFAGTAYRRIHDSLKSGDMQNMLELLRALFASIPYQLHINREAYYHSIFFAIMSVLGFDMDAEVQTSKGRIDAVLELGDKVYIMEFKYKDCVPDADPDSKQMLFDEALEEGMRQIKSRGYWEKYEGSGKSVYQAAFAFLGRDSIEMRVEMR